MYIQRVYHEGLAQASYLIGCETSREALVVDPNRQIEHYLEQAERDGFRITAVAETHIHADFLSGARDLARATGAQLYLSGAGPDAWQYPFAAEAEAVLLHHGMQFHVGTVQVDIWHTPGHTPEHLAFLLTDPTTGSGPTEMLTGDFLFVGDVGRPDLLETAVGMRGTAADSARQLFQSLQQLRTLPDTLRIWPGHGAGSACGRALGSAPFTTLGAERQTNWAFQVTNAKRFAQEVLAGQPATPPYFAAMKRINRAGVPPRPPAALSACDLATLNQYLRAQVPIIDIRAVEAYAAGHIPGTLNLPTGAGFLSWAGWFVPTDQPYALLGDAAQVQAAWRELQLIGADQAQGFFPPELLATWQATERGLRTIERREAVTLAAMVAQREAVIVDVRTPEEYARGHLPGSRNVPLGELPRHLPDLPTDRPVLVHCQGGGRSPIAASMLTARGAQRVVELQDGFAGWQAAGQPIEV